MRYVDDGRILDSEHVAESWPEGTRWNGSNNVSLATASQWDHETLHLTAKGVWWIERTSQRDGVMPSGRVVTPEDACRWLLANQYEPAADDFPEVLRPLVDDLMA